MVNDGVRVEWLDAESGEPAGLPVVLVPSVTIREPWAAWAQRRSREVAEAASMVARARVRSARRDRLVGRLRGAGVGCRGEGAAVLVGEHGWAALERG